MLRIPAGESVVDRGEQPVQVVVAGNAGGRLRLGPGDLGCRAAPPADVDEECDAQSDEPGRDQRPALLDQLAARQHDQPAGDEHRTEHEGQGIEAVPSHG
jgi:hypothetical protein